jgi:glycine/D-amino acid oxidase-like deaminating enzyme
MAVRKTYDVAIVGAGVFGAWIAHELASAGRRVVLLDQHGPGNARASSGGETRIIRMCYGADEIYTRASMRSLPRWKEFGVFQRTGVLFTAPRGDSYLNAARETLTRVRCKFEFFDDDGLARRFPELKLDRGTAGVFEPESGILMARRGVQVLVEAAVKLGARYESWRASAPRRSGAIETSGGTIQAGTVVFACGPWLPSLFPELLGKRIRPSRQQVFFFGTPPGDARFAPTRMPAWITFREGAYCVPAIDSRGFKFAIDTHGPPFDPENGERQITRAKLAVAQRILAKRFPALAGAPLLESRVCQYENTSNGDFLIDRHPDFDNVWLVGGGSGHGFKHGPFVGEYVAAMLAGSGQAEPRFSLSTKGARRQRTVY